MLFTVSVAVALLSSALGVQALPFTNLTSSAAGVITSCTVKNTAALTFDDVSVIFTWLWTPLLTIYLLLYRAHTSTSRFVLFQFYDLK